jgi:uncharacterized protein (TIGR02646 family)
MIPLAQQKLDALAQAELDTLQNQIDVLPTFEEKAEKASALWKTKGSAKGIQAFETIKSQLKSLCVFIDTCNYCEHNEATDIEHVYPKSFFPNLAFSWENYILACKNCNSGYKLDKCYTVDNLGNTYKINRGTEPQHKHAAILNPRLSTDNPNSCMILNTKSFRFDILEDLAPIVKSKTEKTLEILALNERHTLIEMRKQQAKAHYDRLERLSRILNCVSINELRVMVNPYDDFDDNADLQEEKDRIKTLCRSEIERCSHPSVWHAIKTIESQVSPQWQKLFAAIPEALNW